jgi:hypothetical protein
MDAPDVIGYGNCEVEPFSDYLRRWPAELKAFPANLIETWVYRHWDQFRDEWMPQRALEWKYESRFFSNDEVMKIAHFANELSIMDYWGDQLFSCRIRRETWLAAFMLRHGTTPEPILVLDADTKVRHHKAFEGEVILKPFHIIEGHKRLSYLRGMIRHNHPLLKKQHVIWYATANI